MCTGFNHDHDHVAVAEPVKPAKNPKALPTKRVTIEVTQNDIRRGECGSPSACAIALAVRRTLRSKNRYEVDRVQVYDTEEQFESFQLPKKAQKFIDKFDREKSSVKPGLKFTLVLKPREIL